MDRYAYTNLRVTFAFIYCELLHKNTQYINNIIGNTFIFKEKPLFIFIGN